MLRASEERHNLAQSLLIITAASLAIMTVFTRDLWAEAKTEPRLMNISNVLSYYGFNGGKFNSAVKIVKDLDFTDELATGEIEGNRSIIDTPEEFITAAYYTPVQITNVAKAKIEKELPHTKQGALELASMWMKKWAISPENGASYQKAIDIIKQKSNITDAEIREYYATAVEKEVMKLGEKHLSKYYSETELRNTILKPIIDYMLNPTTEGLKKIKEIKEIRSLLLDKKDIFYAYGSVMDDLDPEFKKRVNIV